MKNEFSISDGFLISYHGNSRDVVIPDGVMSIRERAFVDWGWGNTKIENVTLPNGIKNIGKRAFYRCSNLKTINIPDGVKYIGDEAFGLCSSLTNLTIPASVRHIGDGTFGGCCGLESITVDKNNTVYRSDGNCLIEISSKTLVLGCKNSIIPADGSVTSIGDYAFMHCKDLKNIEIPDSITFVSKLAFYYSNLKNVTIGKNMEQHVSAFSSLKLANICVSQHNKQYASIDGVLYNKEKTVLIKYPAMKKTIPIIPSSVKEIAAYAFSNSCIKEITIPESVEKIGENAFGGCSSLQKITNNSSASILKAMSKYNYQVKDGFLPNEVISDLSPEQKNLAVLIFLKNKERYSQEKQNEYSEYLRKQGRKYLSEYISDGKSENVALLLQIYAPTSKILEKSLEEANENIEITSVLLEYQNTHIDIEKELDKKIRSMERAMTRAEPTVEELKKLWIVKTDEDDKDKCYLTKYNGNEKHVVIPAKVGKKKVTAIEGCFSGQDIHSVEIPDSVISIGDSAFEDCSNLTSITIPGSVTSIDDYAFYDCSSLTSIIIPDDVESIGYCAFCGCSSLTSITIPGSATNIGYGAFEGCSNLLIIYATVGSYAEKYAKENNIKFEPIEE